MLSKRGFLTKRNKKVLIAIIVVFLICLITLLTDNRKNMFFAFKLFHKDEFLRSFHAPTTKQPRDGRNIFFLETSGIFKLNARQACAIESAALINPELNVFLLYLSENGFPNATTTPLLEALMKYKNFQMNYFNITKYAEQTPMEEWMKKDELSRSKHRTAHTADVLRFLTLWKYGGTYLDLDVVVLKPLDTIVNYAGAESSQYVAIGIINMNQIGIGHDVADMILRDLIVTYDGEQWSYNGPGVLTRILEKVCKTTDNLEMTSERCQGFQVLPTQYCYAIPYPEYLKFFQEAYLQEVIEKLGDSIIAHVWNKLSETTELSVNSPAAYMHLAKQYCPKVIAACGEFF